MNMYLNLILGQAEVPAGGSFSSSIIMLVLMGAVFYFFLIRPQQKRQKEITEMRNKIAVGDAVVTSGGIHGKVKSINDNVMVIEIANNVNITVDKNAIFSEGTSTDSAK